MNNSITDITVKTIDGKDKSLSDYLGKVLLIVNVASYCGYTPQYQGLEQLNQKYRSAGLEILGFPCNDFGAQEPGTNEQILQFCSRNYGVSFDLFDKIQVIGSQQHPLYARLTKAVSSPGDVSWNFEKFLVNKKGEIVARYRSSVNPESSELVTAIAQELAKS
jgi:glutathione peroxidase